MFRTTFSLLLLLPLPTANAQQQFMQQARRHLPVWTDGAGSILPADVDGDGDQDLVLVDTGGVHVWVQDGQARFTDETAARTPPGLTDSGALAVLDVDHDGDLDLFVGRYNATCLLLRNDGTGRFVDASASLPVVQDYIVSIAVGDVDRDGNLDLVLGTYTSRNHLLLGDGQGFVDGTVGRLPALVVSTANVVLADLDRDGDLDLVVGGFQGGRVQRNDGAGHFTDVTLTHLSFLPIPGPVAVADLDRDGDLDLWFGGSTQGDLVFVNDGTGRFTDETAARLPGIAIPSYRVLLADWDGDGAPDAYLGKGTGGERLFRNDGRGHFSDATAASLPTANRVSSSLATADLDGDSDLDLIIAPWPGQPTILFNDGQGRFHDGVPTWLPNKPYLYTLPPAVAAGDVDGDGRPDIVLAANNQSERKVVLWLNSADTVFRDASDRLPDTSGSQVTALRLGDVDGDGDLDLVLVAWYGAARVFVNDGTGHFTEPTPAALPWMTGSDGVLCDVDGDGDLDLVVVEYTARLWLNDGHGAFSEVTASHLPANVPGRRIAVGDLDGDRDLDLVLGGGPQRLMVLINDGQGHFADESSTRIAATNDSITRALALADIDRDGDLDLMVGNYYQPSQDRLFQNNGQGVFTEITATHLPVDQDFTTSLAMGDLDGDGAPEIVIGSASSRIYHNDGAGHFTDVTATRLAGTVRDTGALALADFDGNGLPDMLFANSAADFLGLNHMNRVAAPFLARVGFEYVLDCHVAPGFAVGGELAIPFLAAGRLAAPIATPMGSWWLDPATAFAAATLPVPAPTGIASLRVVVPRDAALVGAVVLAQALVVPTSAIATWRLTNLLSDPILR